MKKLLAAAFLLLLSVPAFAQIHRFQKSADVETVTVRPNWFGDAATQIRRHAPKIVSNGVSRNVADERGNNAFIIAIVGSAHGANGTFFRSETTFVNNKQFSSQRLLVFYFPVGNAGGCGGGIVKRLTLQPFSWLVYNDVVNDLIGVSGQLGSIVVFGVDSNDNFDSTADIDGASRIWTPSPLGGTGSQFFAPVAFSVDSGTQSAYGLRSDSGFRVNYGIFNYGTDIGLGARAFTVRVYGLDGTTVSTRASVNPCSLTFTSAPSGNFPNGNIILDITPDDNQGEWYGFGSANDNISGDNWSSPTRP